MAGKRPLTVLATAILIGSACAGSDEAPLTTEASAGVQMFPDVISAELTTNGETWAVAATISSPYDSPERYADAFRILTPDGTVLAERILTHDHASEQPFTRSESGVAIPDDVDQLIIEARDLEFGYGGATYQVDVPR